MVTRGMIYGLVAPGYEMAEAVAKTMTGEDQAFTGADMSTKLKLMGVDVASFGRYSGFKVPPLPTLSPLTGRLFRLWFVELQQ